MRKFFQRFRRRRPQELANAQARGAVTVRNTYTHGSVAVMLDHSLLVTLPPKLSFTGVTANGAQLREWARANGITADFNADPDVRFAQIEARSAVQAILWLKRFNSDTGYTYQSESRDCDNFARRARAFPDLFNSPTDAQAANFGIYSEMPFPFAGVADAVHALNAVWTDAGVYVYEPQGLDLIYQRLEDWPNKHGISAVLSD